MKKFLSVLMLLAVLVMLAPAVLADGEPTVTVSQETAAPGEEVSVTVGLENNPGIMACVLGISYDSDALELVSSEHTGLPGTWMIGENAVWVGSTDSYYDGDILYLTFRVKDGASGDAEVTILCGDGAFANSAEESVSFEVVSGGVAVSGDSGTEDESEDEPEEEDTSEDTPAATEKPAETTAATNTTGAIAAVEDTEADEELLESLHDTMLEMTGGEEIPSIAVSTEAPAEEKESEEAVETPEIEHNAVTREAEEDAKGVDFALIAIIVLAVLMVVLIVLIVIVKKRK